MLIDRKPGNADFNFKYGAALGLLAKNSSKFKAFTLLDNIKNYLKKAAKLDPKHVRARHALSQMHIQLPGIVGGSSKTSKRYAKELFDISKIDGLFAYGYIYEFEEDFSKAEDYYKKAVEVGGSVTAFQKLGKLQEYKLLDLDAALATYSQAHTKFPDNQIFADAVRRLSVKN